MRIPPKLPSELLSKFLLKSTFLAFFVLLKTIAALAQAEGVTDKVVITSLNQKTGVRTNEKGELLVNVAPKEAQTFKARGWVRYSDFGAKGDGKTDDVDAIAGAHAFANQQGVPVKADEGRTYYIGGKERTAVIRPNTDFGTAAFLIFSSTTPTCRIAMRLFSWSKTNLNPGPRSCPSESPFCSLLFPLFPKPSHSRNRG